MPHKAIIIINSDNSKRYFLDFLVKQGFSIINVITDPAKISVEELGIKDYPYETVILTETNHTAVLNHLRALCRAKEYIVQEVINILHEDFELADAIRDFFNIATNGEEFCRYNQMKKTVIDQINKTILPSPLLDEPCTLEEYARLSLSQKVPSVIKVTQNEQVLTTYFIKSLEDNESVTAKLEMYQDPQVKLELLPYYEDMYKLQVITFRGVTTIASLWQERYSFKPEKAQKDFSLLIDPESNPVIPIEKLEFLAQQLTNGLLLKQGISEFILVFKEGNPIVIDYNIGLSNINQLEIMQQVLGYSSLSQYLLAAGLLSARFYVRKEFKHILSMPIFLDNAPDVLKLSILPTFRYYYQLNEFKDADCKAELFLSHKDRSLVLVSHASIRNMEHLLSDSKFASHSGSRIVEFYRDAAKSKDAFPKAQLSEITHTLSADEVDDITHLEHEAEHIPQHVQPLKPNANIQDVMRYYIDVYDLYILHGKPPGTQITALNTGNPAFLPFEPIIIELRKSLQESLLSYARYSMQVPETKFIKQLSRYCQEEQIISPTQQLSPDNAVVGNGSTNLYYLALKCLIKNKGDIVLITRPTYGLFIDPVYTAGGDIGFIDVNEKTDWKVFPQILDTTIRFYNCKAFNTYILEVFIKEYKRLLRIIKVFNLDSKALPLMPNITDFKDLKEFDNYIENLNSYIDSLTESGINKEDLKFSFSPRVRAFYHMNPHNPTGAVYTKKDIEDLINSLQSHPDVYVIDDLAHWGVLYGAITPITFASFVNMFDRTITLMSLSKAYCVPGLRSGIALGKTEIIKEMQYRLLNSSVSATLPAMLALDAVFSTSKGERDHYLQTNSQDYCYRRDLMKTLINGIQGSSLSFIQKIKVYQLILENEGCNYKQFDSKTRDLLKLMLSGMPLVQTLTDPKGCFFHLLDISKLIGAKVGQRTLITATDVRCAIYSICKIDTVPGEISGNFFNFSLRMSFSLTPEKIYDACKKIHLFIGNYIIAHNPDVFTKYGLAPHTTVRALAEDEVLDQDILNKALIRVYLNQIVQSLLQRHRELFAANYLQNKPRLQVIDQKIHELTVLMERLLDQTQSEIIYKELHEYFNNNKDWLQIHSAYFTQLQEINDAVLSAPLAAPVSPRSAQLLLRM